MARHCSGLKQQPQDKPPSRKAHCRFSLASLRLSTIIATAIIIIICLEEAPPHDSLHGAGYGRRPSSEASRLPPYAPLEQATRSDQRSAGRRRRTTTRRRRLQQRTMRSQLRAMRSVPQGLSACVQMTAACTLRPVCAAVPMPPSATSALPTVVAAAVTHR